MLKMAKVAVSSQIKTENIKIQSVPRSKHCLGYKNQPVSAV